MAKANTYEEIRNLIDDKLLNEKIIKSLKNSKLLLIANSLIVSIVVLVGIILSSTIISPDTAKPNAQLIIYFTIILFGILGFFTVFFTHNLLFKINIRRIEDEINQTFVMNVLEIILKDFNKFQILKNTSDWENGLIFLTDGNIVVENKLNTTDLFNANTWKARKFNNQKTNQITFLRETILNIFMRDFYENIEKSIEENQ